MEIVTIQSFQNSVQYRSFAQVNFPADLLSDELVNGVAGSLKLNLDAIGFGVLRVVSGIDVCRIIFICFVTSGLLTRNASQKNQTSDETKTIG